jgi:DNA polymerase III delta subunit
MKKYRGIAELKSSSEGIPRSIFILSSDLFQRKELLSFIEEKCGRKAKKVALKGLLEELSTPSFFDETPLLVVELSEKLKNDELQLLQNILAGQFQAILVCMASTLPKNISCDAVVELQEIKPWEKARVVELWIEELLKKRKKSMQKEAITALARELQQTPFLLQEELEKLFLYAHEKKMITLNDVEALCFFEAKPLIWHISDAILQKNHTLSLQYLQAIQESDIHPLQLLRYLRSQFHEALKGNPKPKLEKALALYGTSGLQGALLLIDDLELKLKNSETNELLELELMVIKLCSTSYQTC